MVHGWAERLDKCLVAKKAGHLVVPIMAYLKVAMMVWSTADSAVLMAVLMVGKTVATMAVKLVASTADYSAVSMVGKKVAM